MGYFIKKEECVDCGYCKLLCHFGAIDEVDASYYTVDGSKCIGCAQCFEGCPASAIYPDENQRDIADVSIIEENCIGCSLCMRVCPVGAITGKIKEPFTLHKERCIRCGLCFTKCKKEAIKVVYADEATAKNKVKKQAENAEHNTDT